MARLSERPQRWPYPAWRGLRRIVLAGNAKRHGEATLLGLPAGRVLAAFTSLGLLGTVGEAGLLHFRGNFQNPAMYLPVTLPPIAAAVMAEAALTPSQSQTGVGPRLAWHHVVFSASRASGFIATAFPALWAAGRTGARTSWTARRFPLPELRWSRPRRHRRVDADRKGER